MNKVLIEISPYNAITILSFLREFIDEACDDYNLQAIKQAVDELEIQLAKRLTDEHFEAIKVENELNQLIGKSPNREV